MSQTRTEIRDMLAQVGIAPRSTLGQNFLADPNVIARVVRTAQVTQGDRVLEVGPGTGALTRSLLDAGADVLAIEVDERLQPILEQEVPEARVIWGDAMKFDYRALLGDGPWNVVANLPYQVGTLLVLDWLRFVPAIKEMTVMLQVEVAQRLAAGPGDEAYGLPSVVVGLHSDAQLAFRVPAQVFYPAPKVESAVVRLIRKPPAPGSEEAIRLAAAGFGQRRKMLRRSLASVLDDPVATLERAGLTPTLRAENLTPDDFLRLARA